MDDNTKNILVVGAGYVGISLSVLLAKKHRVTIWEIDQQKVKLINARKSYIREIELESLLKSDLHLIATIPLVKIPVDIDIIIICLPTNWDPLDESLSTDLIDQFLEKCVECEYDGDIVIKSTIPVGYTKSAREKFSLKKLYYSPEFLREGNSINDNKFPARIIVGNEFSGEQFSALARSISVPLNTPTLKMSSTEAELVKVASNSYLAARVAFFNSVDSLAMAWGADSEPVISGISLDPRVGNIYNNPSFGFGGYCLPKDVQQLHSNLRSQNLSNKFFQAISESNEARIDDILKILRLDKNQCIGVYRVGMKTNSDNARDSASIAMIDRLLALEYNVIVYEPTIDLPSHLVGISTNNLDYFTTQVDFVLANRWFDELLEIKKSKPIYCPDLYKEN